MKKNNLVFDLISITKPRLSILVILTTTLSYLIFQTNFNPITFFSLIIGGILVISSSISMNQILEKKFDAKMLRTKNRPIVTGKVTVFQGIFFSIICLIIGLIILFFYVNLLCTVLSFISFIIYAFAYTPLKRISSISVFVGAISGSLPPLLGAIAATNTITNSGLYIFLIQFIWQFPHFWSIAWVYEEDYKKANFKVLPFSNGRSKLNASMIFIYSLCLLLLSIFAPFFKFSWLSTIALIMFGLVFIIPSYNLFKTLETKFAKKIMFISFIYLPIILLAMLIEKIIKIINN